MGTKLEYPIVVDTIGKLIAMQSDLRIYCENPKCIEGRHGVVLDLHALGKRLGFDHGCMHDDLKNKFQCSRCGGKTVSFRHCPDTRPK